MARSKKPLGRIGRLFRYRLIIPVKRNMRRPHYTARGVSVALFWAFTPLIPVQTYCLGLTWFIARRFKHLDFNLVVALAWIWVTNVVTAPPVYFLFYVTGQTVLGRGHLIGGFETFQAQWEQVLSSSDGVWPTVLAALVLLSEHYGVALFVGCIPYALIAAGVGYVATLRLMTGLVTAKTKKRNHPTERISDRS